MRDVPDAASILDQQFERTRNPDRKAQFAFVRPALSAEPAERDAWFASLADVANRRHEPWVLEGLRYLHHPLARRRVREVHRAEPAAAARDPADRRHLLSEALDGHDAERPPVARRRRDGPRVPDHQPPDYPERLRRVILSSADDLFRAAGATR